MKKVFFLILVLISVLMAQKSFAMHTDKDAIDDFNQGMKDVNGNKPMEAISEFTRAIEINPRYADAYNNRGLAYARQGGFTQAIDDYNKAIEIDPKYSEAYCERGFIYYIQGKVDQAFVDFTKAIELNPKYAEAYNNRGVAYGNQGKFTQAIADLTKTIEINPKADVYFSRANIYYKTKEYNKSWADVRNAEKLGATVDPKFTDALKKASGKNQ